MEKNIDLVLVLKNMDSLTDLVLVLKNMEKNTNLVLVLKKHGEKYRFGFSSENMDSLVDLKS